MTVRSTTLVTARIVGPQYRLDGEYYTRGDVVVVPEWTLDSHPNTLERVVEDDESAGNPDTDEDSAAGGGDDQDDETEGEDDQEASTDVEPVAEEDLDPHPSDLTVPELEERLPRADDLALLVGIRDAEENGENRTTALEAIDDRIDELEG